MVELEAMLAALHQSPSRDVFDPAEAMGKVGELESKWGSQRLAQSVSDAASG